jgi:hypothetical protein
MDRICCLTIAAEVRRMIVDCEPAFEIRVIYPIGLTLLFKPGSARAHIWAHGCWQGDNN